MLVRSLLSAGVDTTVYGIGNALQALSANLASWPGCARSRPWHA